MLARSALAPRIRSKLLAIAALWPSQQAPAQQQPFLQKPQPLQGRERADGDDQGANARPRGAATSVKSAASAASAPQRVGTNDHVLSPEPRYVGWCAVSHPMAGKSSSV